ncbi:hypothetical protein K8Z61_18400 [Nocardioides sp. TRM66260-LWL]|uniref:hypothetical protein n=1 Tax=Nocardioides sp. TRM66260-LWL TaxID=2874478 RepID=UPI001CC7D716|nr:hypothetical protein [Nocardioides sp. TRM66260-LWL]MBZ5736466.1 hypothetical protein [Nocardioides sp. TRM66260-LWL]
MTYRNRPLSDRTWINPTGRQASTFKAPWLDTVSLLETEVDRLNGSDLVIELDITEADLKLNGEIRANARPASDAVVVAFDTAKHGPMLYRCDRWTAGWRIQGWQANVRAIALTLLSLRAVDRYGATETGQQYTGFKALPAGSGTPASHMTREQALEVFGQHGRAPSLAPIPGERVNTDPEVLRSMHRRARRVAHPDLHDGDRTLWDQVEQAAKVLGVDR